MRNFIVRKQRRPLLPEMREPETKVKPLASVASSLPGVRLLGSTMPSYSFNRHLLQEIGTDFFLLDMLELSSRPQAIFNYVRSVSLAGFHLMPLKRSIY